MVRIEKLAPTSMRVEFSQGLPLGAFEVSSVVYNAAAETLVGLAEDLKETKYRVRALRGYLREHGGTDISSATLVISGNDVLLCDGDTLIDIVRRGGQGVLNVLAIGSVKTDLDASLVELAAAHGDDAVALPAQAV